MPIQTAQFNLVEDVAQRIVAGHSMVTEVHIHNHEHSQARNVFIGAGSAVTASTGHHILAEDNLSIFLQPGDEVWAVTDNAAGCSVTVLALIKG